MFAVKLPDGNILAPVTLEGSGAVGDCMKEVSKDSPLHKEWHDYYESIGEEMPDAHGGEEEDRKALEAFMKTYHSGSGVLKKPSLREHHQNKQED